MWSVFLWFLAFTSLFLALFSLVFPVTYAQCPLYKNESWDQAAVLKSHKNVCKEKRAPVCVWLHVQGVRKWHFYDFFSGQDTHLQISKSWGTKYFPPCWKTRRWRPSALRRQMHRLLVDLWCGEQFQPLGSWNTGNPLWCFCSATSLSAVHPISTLKLEISSGDLPLTMGSNNLVNISYAPNFICFKKKQAARTGAALSFFQLPQGSFPVCLGEALQLAVGGRTS